jgi:hypothetical protein
MVKALMLAATLLLAGCATMPIQVGIPCNVGPFEPDKGASTRWTRGEKEQLVTLNETGQRYCGWKPA